LIILESERSCTQLRLRVQRRRTLHAMVGVVHRELTRRGVGPEDEAHRDR